MVSIEEFSDSLSSQWEQTRPKVKLRDLWPKDLKPLEEKEMTFSKNDEKWIQILNYYSDDMAKADFCQMNNIPYGTFYTHYSHLWPVVKKKRAKGELIQERGLVPKELYRRSKTKAALSDDEWIELIKEFDPYGDLNEFCRKKSIAPITFKHMKTKLGARVAKELELEAQKKRDEQLQAQKEEDKKLEIEKLEQNFRKEQERFELNIEMDDILRLENSTQFRTVYSREQKIAAVRRYLIGRGQEFFDLQEFCAQIKVPYGTFQRWFTEFKYLAADMIREEGATIGTSLNKANFVNHLREENKLLKRKIKVLQQRIRELMMMDSLEGDDLDLI